MTTPHLPEAKRAWLIVEMIEALNELLWKHYEEEFNTFLLEEDPPITNHYSLTLNRTIRKLLGRIQLLPSTSIQINAMSILSE